MRELPYGSQPPAPTCVVRSWQLRADYIGLIVLMLPDGYAMLMRPNKAETAVHGFHCSGDISVRMLKVCVTCFFIVVFTFKVYMTRKINSAKVVKTE